ncbi:restriction endonuclease subunit S [Lactobacillus johnsonii]|uniref:restriction endonuclease subunit S n=1 Tax=Lactobacillus johnsonii TaxID=33959 RepID=UPI003562E90D
MNNQYPVLTSSRQGIFFQKDYYDGNQIASKNNVGYNIVPRDYFTYRHMSDDTIFHFNINTLCDYGIVSTLYPVFTTINQLSSSWLYYYLNYGNDMKRYALLQKQGGSRTYMYFSKLKNMLAHIPSVKEQDSIAKILLKIDKLITLQQRKLKLLKLLKKAMLQTLFTNKSIPNLRFISFDKSWDIVKLKDVGKATGGTSIESEFTSIEGTHKVISIGSYKENHTYNDQGIRVNLNDKTKKRVLNKDDLTMILNDKTTSGRIIGSVLLIPVDNVFVYNQRTERIEPNHKKFSSKFLYQYLNSPNIRNKIVSNAQGNTQIYVNWSSISKIKYLMPQKKEQDKISKLLFILDFIINNQQLRIKKYERFKQFLLQNMFI